MRNTRKVFYGWWIVGSLILANLVHAGCLFYIFGIFYEPLHKTFGWDRFETAGAMTIYTLTLGLSAPLIGRFTDRFGPKKVLLAGAFIGGVCFFVMPYIQALWHFYALYFLLGLAFSACGVVPVSTAVTSWFEDKRGIAMGVTMVGISLGAVVITPVGGIILEGFGWRVTYLYLGLCSWFLVIPPILLLMKDTPQEMGLLPYRNATRDYRGQRSVSLSGENGPTEPLISLTFPDAIKHASLWLIGLAYFFVFFTIGAVLGHQIVFLTDMGISMAAAAMALGVTGGMGGLGKIVFGLLADRYSPKPVVIFCIVFQGIGILFLLFAKSMPLVWVYALVFGFSMGGHMALQPLLVAHFFGLSSYGSIYGIISMIGALGSSLGPVTAGKMYDILGHYQWTFLVCCMACAVACVGLLSARRPKRSAT